MSVSSGPSRRGLLLAVFAPVLSFILLGLVAFGALASAGVRSYFFELSSYELGELAGVAARAIRPLAEGEAPPEELDAFVDSLAGDSPVRLTYMDPSGKVLADSSAEPVIMQDHGDRSEVREALERGRGFARRRSASVAAELAYAAVALKRDDGSVLGIARASLPVTVVTSQVSALSRRLALIGLFIAFGAGLSAFALARNVARSVGRIREGALAFAQGRLDAPPLPVSGPREIAELASSLNRMAAELDGRMNLIRDQKREAEAVLSGMSEGVIVLRADLAVRSANPAAERLFGTASAGRSLIEFCRNTELAEFAAAALAAREGMETTIAVSRPREAAGQAEERIEERSVRVTSSPLGDGQAVLVLNDLTRMNRLETVRRDFVANVSHELKTPLTVVRTALETLQGMESGWAGAEAEAARRFLSSAARQAERLSAIIEDILALARIEEEEGKGIDLERSPLRPVLESTIEAIRPLAEAKSITLSLDCPEALDCPMKAPLVAQAVSNLADNAVKYSESGTAVRIEAEAVEGFARISVIDEGHGIPAKDRHRVFERFYRVDPSRSRELGGTGLGLSIAKHIAKAHGGSVTLESEEGRGSTFTILLPR